MQNDVSRYVKLVKQHDYSSWLLKENSLISLQNYGISIVSCVSVFG